jgi:predicted DsbA family dithiol-disulfide isomerase
LAEIEVFADVWCPFTHFGLRRFVAARAAGRVSGVLRVRSWPLELVNGKPLDRDLVAEEIEEIRRNADADAFAGFDKAAFPRTTIPALRLAAAAYASGVETGEAVSLELRNRLFELGQDISDASVLSEVAASHGVDGDDPSVRDVPERDWEAGKRRGVEGSPHYFTPGGDFFCPSVDVEKVDGRVRVKADPEEFDRFLESCQS